MSIKAIAGEIVVERHTTLVPIECGNCGVLFGLEAEYQRKRRSDRKTWYCPNGCARAYTESEADRLRQLLDDQRTATARYQDMLNAEKRAHSATKGQLTRLINKGVCPYCRRNFTAVRRHIANKHPEQAGATK